MNKTLLVVGLALLFGALIYHNSDQAVKNDTIPKPYVQMFSDYKKTFNKRYGTDMEDNYRLTVFYPNMKDVERNNADPLSTFTMGQTQFSDLTQEEFKAKYLIPMIKPESNSTDIYQDKNFKPKNKVDWRTHPGVSTHIKDQGQCGSCWAFSAVGAVESYFATTKKQKDLDLSEQQLVDCQTNGSYGCSGGWPSLALQWVADHGLVAQSEYPYTARGGTCLKEGGLYKIQGIKKIANDESSLKSAIKQSPVSVCLDASNWFQYKEGILNECGTGLNHAVLAFGYDKGFWLIKNSWGSGWGEKGFIRIKDGNTCNIMSESFIAI